jgi:hypothetical protein
MKNSLIFWTNKSMITKKFYTNEVIPWIDDQIKLGII